MSRVFACLLALCLCLPASGRADEVLRFCYDPYPPFALGQEGPTTRGISVALLQAVVAQIEGVSATVTLLPWKRCQSEARAGRFDGILPLFRNETRASYLTFSAPAFVMETVLWARSDQFDDPTMWEGEIAELADLRLGMLNGGYVDAQMESLFAATHGITRARDAPTLMRLLVQNRIDLVATEAAVGRYVLHQLGWQERIRRLSQPVSRQTTYFGLSKASGADRHLAAFNAALDQLHARGAVDQLLATAEGQAP